MHIIYNLAELKALATRNRDLNNKLVAFLKKNKPAGFDQIVNKLHYDIFKKTDCLKCANCCAGLGPRIENKDIKRLSAATKITEKDFINTYLRIDEDRDFVFKQMPCPFLNAENNYCNQYNNRPQACARYPHTNEPGQLKLLNIFIENTYYCPVVYEVARQLRKIYKIEA